MLSRRGSNGAVVSYSDRSLRETLQARRRASYLPALSKPWSAVPSMPRMQPEAGSLGSSVKSLARLILSVVAGLAVDCTSWSILFRHVCAVPSRAVLCE